MKFSILVCAGLAGLMLVASPVKAEGERGERGGRGERGDGKMLGGVISEVTKTEEKVTGFSITTGTGEKATVTKFAVNGETAGVDLIVKDASVLVKYTVAEDVNTAKEVKAKGEGSGEGEKKRGERR